MTSRRLLYVPQVLRVAKRMTGDHATAEAFARAEEIQRLEQGAQRRPVDQDRSPRSPRRCCESQRAMIEPLIAVEPDATMLAGSTTGGTLSDGGRTPRTRFACGGGSGPECYPIADGGDTPTGMRSIVPSFVPPASVAGRPRIATEPSAATARERTLDTS